MVSNNIQCLLECKTTIATRRVYNYRGREGGGKWKQGRRAVEVETVRGREVETGKWKWGGGSGNGAGEVETGKGRGK